MLTNHIIYKQDFALNNPQWLIYHETQPNQTMYKTKINIYNIMYGK